MKCEECPCKFCLGTKCPVFNAKQEVAATVTTSQLLEIEWKMEYEKLLEELEKDNI